MADVVVRRHVYVGMPVMGSYDVFLDDVKIGTVRRNDGVSTGYFGRWHVGTTWFSTRKEAVDYLVKKRRKV